MVYYARILNPLNTMKGDTDMNNPNMRPADMARIETPAQAEQSGRNVGAILEAAGSGYDKVVKTTCFLADMGDFAAFNEVYAKYFTSRPARSCVAVRELPKGVLCEVEAVAVME